MNQGLEDITVAETRLSDIDGKTGTLVIGGFPVEELAANATYEETVFLLLNDRLPTETELRQFRTDLARQRDIDAEVRNLLQSAADAGVPPMDALRMGAATANLDFAEDEYEATARRVVAVFPTIVATYWRYRRGEESIRPRDDLGHAANYLYMLTGDEPDAAAVTGLETYLNTVIDHGLNASTFAARVIVSTESDVVSAATAAVGALKGPLHGGAPGPVLDMLLKVKDIDDIEGYIQDIVHSGDRLMGFGHRVYSVRDPRAAVLSTAAERFYDASGDTDFFRTITEFEEIAVDVLSEYKPDRQLQTNVEFYTAALLHGVGIPKALFTATFGVARVGGWMAHSLEQLQDNRLIRPRSTYVGASGRTWIPIEERSA